jgi:hypothetical protein
LRTSIDDKSKRGRTVPYPTKGTKMRKTMAKSYRVRLLAALLAVVAAAVVLVPVASAETVGTNSFPGSTGAIAFVSTRDDTRNWQVYRMNPDGFGPTRITNQPGLKCAPNWSADGTKLAFSSFVIGTPGDVYQIGADGSGEKNLTNALSDDGDPPTRWQAPTRSPSSATVLTSSTISISRPLVPMGRPPS